MRRSKSQRPLCQNWRQKDQKEYAKEASDSRSQERQLQRFCPLAFCRHGVPVKCRGNVGRGTGDLQKDRAYCAARDSRGISRTQQDKPLLRLELEGKGDQQRHRHCWRKARSGTQNQAADCAQQQQSEVDRGEHVPHVEQEIHFCPVAPTVRLDQ